MTAPDPRPVLLAVGSEPGSDAALRFAGQETLSRGCPLVLLHCYLVLPTGPETALLEFAKAEEVARSTLRGATEHAKDLLGSVVPVSSRLVREAAVRAVVDASEHAQLVVLERPQRPHLTRLLTRSTSNGVAAHAHSPVVVVPEEWAGAAGGDVVVGVDVPERCEAILVQALAEARARHTSLRVVHTSWSPGYFDGTGVSPASNPRWAEEATAKIRAVLDGLGDEAAGVPVSVDISYDRPADALAEASATAGLVVVGRHDPLVPSGSHLGPVARTLLRAARCPVLLVAPSPAHRGWPRGARRTVADAGPLA
jgi:nucleotide-binding universal stress UspA family protein